jgi:hypothetical protein
LFIQNKKPQVTVWSCGTSFSIFFKEVASSQIRPLSEIGCKGTAFF